MLKTKARDSLTTHSGGLYQHKNCSDGAVTSTYYDPPCTSGTYESITYECGRKYAERKVLTTNYCNHIRNDTDAFPLNIIRGYYAEYLHFQNCLRADLGFLPVYSGSSPSFAGAPSEAELDQFNARAFDAMRPSLEQSLNLTNFLLELCDIKSLLKLFRRHAADRNLLQMIAGKGAEGHLTWSFAVKPFISDASEIYRQLTNYQAIIDDFLERRGKIQKRYYREVSLDETSEDTVWGNWTNWVIRRVKSKYTMTATMTYTYTAPDLDTLSDQMKAFRDITGLRFTAANVWEAIPFSFVVDWFFRIGDWLENFQEPLIRTQVTVIDYSIAYKLVEDEVRTYYGIASCLGPEVSQVVSKSNRKQYKRRRCLPNASPGYFSITSGQFGLKQLALSGSMAYLMIRR